MTAEQVLAKALERLDGGRGWCQRSAARDADGNAVTSDNPAAVRWCLLGAVGSVIPDESDSGLYFAVRSRLQRVIGAADPDSVFPWNDAMESFGPVAAAIRSAIEDGK